MKYFDIGSCRMSEFELIARTLQFTKQVAKWVAKCKAVLTLKKNFSQCNDSSYDQYYNIKNIFIHPCCSFNRCMKMLDRRDDKTNYYEHNSTQLRANGCNDLPCLLSFDIIFYLICIFFYIFLLDFLLNFSLAKMNRHINRSGSFLKFTTHWCCAPYQVLYINKYVLILDIKRSHESHGLYEALDPSNELQFRLTQHWCTPFGRRNCSGNCCEVNIVR